MEFRSLVEILKSRLLTQTRAYRWRYLTQLREGEELDFTTLDYIEGVPASTFLEDLLFYGKIGIIHAIDPRETRIHKLHKVLLKLYRNQKNLRETLGARVFYLGYPFVQGKLGDGTLISTPLYLFPLELIHNSGKFPRWTLKIASRSEWNQLFLLLYNQIYSVSQSTIIPLSNVSVSSKSLSNYLINLRKELLKNKVELRFPSSIFVNPLLPFQSLSEDEVEPGELNVYPYAVIGFFVHPWIVLFNAYEELQKHEEYYRKRFYDLLSIKSSKKSDTSIYLPLQIHPLDHTQLEVLSYFFNQGSLVVEGPPGTGKSLTIAHVILNALYHDLSVLFVAEKWTALDVVYKLLVQSGVDFIIPPVQSWDEDRSLIFQFLANIIEKVELVNELEAKNCVSVLNHLSGQIKTYIEPFQKGLSILFKPVFDDETPFSLYSKLEKEYAIYNVKKYASFINKHRLEIILTKIRRILPYLDLLEPKHPWYYRKNFSSISLTEMHDFEDFLRVKLPLLIESRKSLKEKLILDINSKEYDFTGVSYDEIEKLWDRYCELVFPLLESDTIRELIQLYQASEFSSYLNDVEEVNRLVSQIQGIDLENWAQVLEAENLFQQIKLFENHYLKYFFPSYYKAKGNFRNLFKSIVLKPYLKGNLEKIFDKINNIKNILNRLKENPVYTYYPLEHPIQSIKLVEELKNVKNKIEVILSTPWFKSWVPGVRNGIFHSTYWEEDIQKIKELIELKKEWDQVHSILFAYITPEQLERIDQNPSFISELLDSFQKDGVRLIELDKIIEGFDVTEKEILSIVKPHLSLEDNLWELYLRHSFYMVWIEEIEKNFPELRFFSTNQVNSFCKTLQSLMKDWIDLSARALFFKRALDVKPLVGSSEWQKLKGDLSKKRNRLTVKSLIAKHSSILKHFFKIILCRSEEALKAFELKDSFDMLIFDEASQLPLETTFPHLFLGKRVMVCGDKYQLPPTRIFTSLFHNENDEAEDSLLDFSIHRFPTKKLLWHYRSQHPVLISFSNEHFYDNQLLILPSPNLPPPASVLFYHRVNGTWSNQTNLVEAQEVVKLLTHYYSQDPIPGIAIITFNYPQQQLIESLVEQWIDTLEPDEYHRLYPYLLGDHEQSLLIRNIERIQGEERDIVIFSIGYGPREDGSFPAQFGLLNYEGGENRLNVAITRAKKTIHIVASFSPEQLKVEETKHRGPKLLKSYLFFVYLNAKNTSSDFSRKFLDDTSSHYLQDAIVEKVKEPLLNYGYKLYTGESNFFPFFSKNGEAIIVEGWKMSKLQNCLGRYFHLPWFLEERKWKPIFINFRSIALEGKETIRKIVEQ